MRLPYVLLLALVMSCNGCGPGGPGDKCNPGNSDSCEEGLVCEADAEDRNVCQIPRGGECDPAEEEDFCQGDSECYPIEDGEEGEARCLAARGATCEEDDECAPGLVCAESGGESKCFEDVVIRGRVFDSASDEGIGGAHVIALDDRKTAVSNVAISADDGAYELSVPAPRDDEGKPIDVIYTLRASAQDYQTFPSGIRTALPIEADTATKEDEGPYVLQNAITDIALIILEDAERGRPSISGEVVSETRAHGVLVVAEAASTHTAVSDVEGNFTIFNVPSGSYEVRGYAQGVQLTPVSVDVSDENVDGVVLEESDAGLSTVTGSINPVEGAPPTSVVLVVESTFDELFVRGEVPSGLRAPATGAPDITGAWTIEGVPEGRYVVLAAFENDDAVRDPDQAIAGTDIVHIDVPAGQDAEVPGSPKITEALDVISPGANGPEGLDTAPTLRWQDDSSEKFYEVRVYNAYGDEVWTDLMVPEVSGGGEVSIPYGGPFEDGMYYQFRATSFREPGGQPTPISTTEDLRGVFFKN